ncbi:MAG: 4Fe-4S dicluster domain-containing protein [Fervidobacterium sp.]|nr:4Fe-4S dicluster domain-containing protein [Fervidobacterium sp.]
MFKSLEEINKKIAEGKAVVLTAQEVVKMAKEEGISEVVKKVDVVTTGTFAPMCSSGAFINFGHTFPPMKMEKIKLGGVEVYGGIAAVDGYLGATQKSDYDVSFGGAHIIEMLIRGENILLEAWGSGTDCYPGKYFKTYINKNIINDFFLFNPRNAYQNYAAATNGSDRIIYTYMGKLLPNYGNVNYSTSGELSPLLKDPKMQTIGIGTKIFLGGTVGYVAWYGTQFKNVVKENEYGVPIGPSRTLALVGDAKKMSADFVKGAYFKNYGVTLFVGVGIPIPVVNEEIAYYVSLSNREIYTELRDYSKVERPILKIVNYEELQSGKIELDGKIVRTSPLTSIRKSLEIASILKIWILEGKFLLSNPVEKLSEERSLKSLNSTFVYVDMREHYHELKSKYKRQCLNCGACIGVCEYGALYFDYFDNNSVRLNSQKCVECLLCSDVCPIGIKLPYEKNYEEMSRNEFPDSPY